MNGPRRLLDGNRRRKLGPGGPHSRMSFPGPKLDWCIIREAAPRSSALFPCLAGPVALPDKLVGNLFKFKYVGKHATPRVAGHVTIGRR
jgi:hypothetical protein